MVHKWVKILVITSKFELDLYFMMLNTSVNLAEADICSKRGGVGLGCWCPWFFVCCYIHCLLNCHILSWFYGAITFLAHQIRVSAVVTHLREFYPAFPLSTHVIDKKRITTLGKTSDFNVMLKWRNHVMLHIILCRNLKEHFSQYKIAKFYGEQEV